MSISEQAFRDLAEQMEKLAHSQRGLREVLQGMALPLFDDPGTDQSASNPSVAIVKPKGSAPLQIVRSVLYVTTAANSTLTLGSRVITIPTAEIRVLGPLWLQLRPQDKRQLSVPAATGAYLELMGFEVPNVVISEFMFRLTG